MDDIQITDREINKLDWKKTSCVIREVRACCMCARTHAGGVIEK